MGWAVRMVMAGIIALAFGAGAIVRAEDFWKLLGFDDLAKALELQKFCTSHRGDARCKKLEETQRFCRQHPMDAERCDPPSAGRLLQDCDSQDSLDHAACAGALDAFLDNGAAPQAGKPLLPELQVPAVPALACVPAAVFKNPEQIRLLFVRAAHDHPEVLHFSARRLLYYALASTFPCANPLKQR